MLKKLTGKLMIAVMALMVVLAFSAGTADAKTTFRSPVTKVKTASVDYDAIKISWAAKSGAEGYQIYSSVRAKEDYQLAAEVTGRSRTIRGLETGKRYYFKVRAYRTDGDGNVKYSRFSSIVNGVPKLLQPTLKVKAGDRYDSTSRWDNVNGAEGWELQRGTYQKVKIKKKTRKIIVYTQVGTGTSDQTSYYEDILSAGKAYYYRVREYRVIEGRYYYSSWSKARTMTIPVPANGNVAKYSYKNETVRNTNALKGKNVFFLGSSVTAGYKAGGQSFADFLAVRDGCSVVKEAISGTCLTNVSNDPKILSRDYLTRLREYMTVSEEAPDIFVCQLSTNDATLGRTMGSIQGPEYSGSYDTSTIAGSIETIIKTVEDEWDCPVVFYTSMPFNNDQYRQMVAMLYDIQEAWTDEEEGPAFYIIDLYNDPDGLLNMDSLDGETFRLYMYDRIHPTKAGYGKWITPVFEAYLVKIAEAADEADQITEDEEEPDQEADDQTEGESEGGSSEGGDGDGDSDQQQDPLSEE